MASNLCAAMLYASNSTFNTVLYQASALSKINTYAGLGPIISGIQTSDFD